MSFLKWNPERHFDLEPPTPEEEQAQAQASDVATLTRAKELLCDLWKAGRVTAEVRFDAEAILSAALYAVENPAAKNLTKHEGAGFAGSQWIREQRRSNEPF